MKRKLSGRTIFQWNRKYMFSWHHWHDTYCHLGVLTQHLACFLTCWSRPFSVATSNCTTNAKMSPNVSLSTLPNAICCRLLQSDWSSPFLAGREVEAKMPCSHGLGAELESKFFMQCLLWGHVHRHCCLCVHSSCQLVPVLYSCIKPLLLSSSQNYRMAGVWRDLWRSHSPILLLKHTHWEQAAQDCVQVGFECLQGRRIHNLSVKAS